jgi:hypothetical protein
MPTLYCRSSAFAKNWQQRPPSAARCLFGVVGVRKQAPHLSRLDAVDRKPDCTVVTRDMTGPGCLRRYYSSCQILAGSAASESIVHDLQDQLMLRVCIVARRIGDGRPDRVDRGYRLGYDLW